MAFLNDVEDMNDTGPIAVTGSLTTTKTYKGEPGVPTGGVVLDKMTAYCIAAVASGTAANYVGAYTVQGSLDNVNWFPVTTLAPTNSGPVAAFIESTPAYKYVQVTGTNTGTSQGTVQFKLRKITRSPL